MSLPLVVALIFCVPVRLEGALPLILPTPAVEDTVRQPASPPDTSRPAAADTAGRRALPDSLAAKTDTLGRMSTPSLVGTVDRWLDSSRFVTRNDLNWIDHRYLGDVLLAFPGVYIRDQASAGQYNQVSFGGVDWRSIAVTSNGRVLNDPASGVYNLFHFTTEYADRIEVVSGPRAFLYGFGGAGGVINLVTKNYNSNKAFTKIDYSEGPYNYAFSDGTFSQNVSRTVNITLGYQHQGTDGRYPNSADDSWNARAKLRYNPIKDLNIILSEYFTSTFLDMNGGVDVEASGIALAFDPRLATMKNTDSYEKVTRHDVDLSFVGTFLGDTANVSTLSFYYSHSLREYRDEENRFPSNGILIRSDQRSSWMGGTFTQNLDAEFTRLTLGADLELRQIEGSPNIGRRRDLIAAAFGKDDILLGEFLVVSGYGRLDHVLGTPYLGAGGDATLKLTPSLSVYGGASVASRPPNYQEAFWTDSTVSRTGDISAERHLVFEAGMNASFGNGSTVHLAYVHRTIQKPILLEPLAGSFVFPGVTFTNGPDLNIEALEAKAGIRLWHLYFEGNATYLVQHQSGSQLDLYPHLFASGGIYFWDALLGGKLNLKAGVRGRLRTRYTGEVYNPEVIAYVPNSLERLGVASSADLFVIARIGDAYIHIMWENLTDVQYFTTPFYVADDRGVRFGISWEFLN